MKTVGCRFGYWFIDARSMTEYVRAERGPLSFPRKPTKPFSRDGLKSGKTHAMRQHSASQRADESVAFGSSVRDVLIDSFVCSSVMRFPSFAWRRLSEAIPDMSPRFCKLPPPSERTAVDHLERPSPHEGAPREQCRAMTGLPR